MSDLLSEPAFHLLSSLDLVSYCFFGHRQSNPSPDLVASVILPVVTARSRQILSGGDAGWRSSAERQRRRWTARGSGGRCS